VAHQWQIAINNPLTKSPFVDSKGNYGHLEKSALLRSWLSPAPART